MDLKIKNDEYLLEMARIGFLPNFGDIEIYVHTDDSANVPHFHIRKRGNKGVEWECCVKYEECTYFSHSNYAGKLPDEKHAKDLDSFFKMKDQTSFGNQTYWQTAIIEWNRNNSSIVLPLDLKQPNYSKL